MSPERQGRDLTSGVSWFLLWGLPTGAVVLGFNWHAGRPWLWTPALLVAGIGCVVNAMRCGRLHCYLTGPIFLLAAAYVALNAVNILPPPPGILLVSAFGLVVLARLAEIPLGKYRK